MPETYSQAIAREAAILDRRIADIRRRQDDGELTVRQAADERITAMENHLAALRRLSEIHLSGAGEGE